MSLYFTSDPHLRHKNIHKFRPCASSPEENEELFFEEMEQLKKQDILYCLGDVFFDQDNQTVERFKAVPCRKKLIMGNHDTQPMEFYLDIFESIHGMVKYKEFWLTHSPIHPLELRGKVNIHGHVHSETILVPFAAGDMDIDHRYFNVCPEEMGQYIIQLEDLRSRIKVCESYK